MEKLDGNYSTIRIPISVSDGDIPIVNGDFVLCVPTYGGGSERSAIPRQVRQFLNIPENRSHLKGVIGFGNTNFGDHYCKAARLISKKTGVPVIDQIEIFGTPEDVKRVNERLKEYDNN